LNLLNYSERENSANQQMLTNWSHEV